LSGTLYEELSWLPPAPADFRQRYAALDATEDPVRELRALSRHALKSPQLGRLAAVLKRLSAAGRTLSPLTPFKLGVLGNGTLDMIVPSLVGTAIRHGFALECVTAPYGAFAPQALDPGSDINRARCDAVLLALDARALPLRQAADAADALAIAAEAVDQVEGFIDAISSHSGAICIVQTLAAFPETLFGSADRIIPAAPRFVVDAFNRELVSRMESRPDIVLDVAGLAEMARWHSPEQWNLAKLPFSDDYVPLYANHVGRLLGALRGKSRRCLVLDLDNTLWKGVIGDDGMEGIVIAEGDAEGEAYRAVQRMALDLRRRGIVLAVSSKNDDAVARRVFREHPEMLIREEHLTVFQANWNDKATNIKAVSEELSLGLDAFVFLDDNPVERGIIRQMLPDVAVPELPADPALYARTLAAGGYFESLAFSEEDRKRADFYASNAQRVSLKRQAGDMKAYLSSLDMEITFAPFDEQGRSRITQLINKSNQFNLTTRRYTEAEVAALEHDPDCLTLQIRLTDIYGDNGMISVVICRPVSGPVAGRPAWEIDTWLMSCRVLGREVERMVLRELMLQARSRGVATLIGCYKSSGRNDMVRDHYAKLGFDPGEEEGVWLLDTDKPEPAATMRVFSRVAVAV
jgi:FkbH-like protein